MALSVEQLATAIRAGTSDQETEVLTRLLAVGIAIVEKTAPNAPEDVRDQATVRLVGYLLDAPNTPAGIALADALTNSGAYSLLFPWKEARAASFGEAE